MNELDDTFCDVSCEWERLSLIANDRAVSPSDLIQLRQALHAHGVAMVAAKRDALERRRHAVKDVTSFSHLDGGQR